MFAVLHSTNFFLYRLRNILQGRVSPRPLLLETLLGGGMTGMGILGGVNHSLTQSNPCTDAEKVKHHNFAQIGIICFEVEFSLIQSCYDYFLNTFFARLHLVF